ncbi:peptidylglycine alpha-hydroxylating monooxygenase-like [Tachypleus tridentatus]|uniref:peptidylglycine alpha-hydroxylating monooxygenase-like n=1 Tax=Tachypleus tridentatus TaxID=6853 RepID=UPI003FD2AD56
MLGNMEFLSIWLVFVLIVTHSLATVKFPMHMPDVQPTQKETYLCTAFKMPAQEHQYIVEFEPNATMHTAHHILIYGCSTPGFWATDDPRAVWDCGEMAGGVSEYRRAPTCASGSQVIYAWARDAPKLTLPEGVGFKVGGSDTGIEYLVLQVHYANVDKFINGATDDSGVILSMLPGTTNKVNKRAAILLLGTGGIIPAHREGKISLLAISQ